MYEQKIPLSKLKMSLLMLGCAAFVFLGIYILINGDQMQSRRATNPWLMKVIAGISIAFFGLILVFLVKKISDKKDGLLISSKGIWDNSGPLSVGWIVWEDIKHIRVEKVMSSKFILIEVHNPQKYLNKATSKFKARVMVANYKKYGAPISISSNGLRWNFKRVEEAVLKAWKKNQSTTNTLQN